MSDSTISLNQELLLSYDEYVKYLLDKYGPAQYDYFCNKSCKSKNSKISRSQEGLFCHHIDENKEILLSTPEVARQRPFEYQKAERLVYANYLEHLLLHIKIVEEDNEGRGLGLGGVIMISGAINDYFRHHKADGWRKYAMEHVKGRYNDYISILEYFQNIISENQKLKHLLPAPILAQGWYGRVNQKVHKDLYGCYATGEIVWSNADLLAYLEEQHKNIN